VRLVQDGVVELYHPVLREWGGVCGSNLTDEVARVVCGDLGLGDTGILVPHHTSPVSVQVCLYCCSGPSASVQISV